MDGMSRRKFFVAGAGVAAGAVVVTLPGSASATAAGAGRIDAKAAGDADGVIVHVRDARKGELVIMGADSEVTVTDHRLVAALGRAARTGKKV